MTVCHPDGMSEDAVQTLTSRQLAELRRQLRERDEQIVSRGPLGVPAAPLPGCPACEVEVERIDQRLEEPKFAVGMRVLRLRWLPCGHRFRAATEEPPSMEECEGAARRVLEFGAPKTTVYGSDGA